MKVSFILFISVVCISNCLASLALDQKQVTAFIKRNEEIRSDGIEVKQENEVLEKNHQEENVEERNRQEAVENIKAEERRRQEAVERVKAEEIVRQEAAEINRQITEENVKAEEMRRQEAVENVKAEERRRQEALERVKAEEIVRQEAAEINRQITEENVKAEEKRRQEAVENVKAEERRRQQAVERVKAEEIVRQEAAEINRQITEENVKAEEKRRQEAVENVKAEERRRQEAVERVTAEEIVRQEAAEMNRQKTEENVKAEEKRRQEAVERVKAEEIVRQEAAEINHQKSVENVKAEERRRQEAVENVKAEERRRQEAVERVKAEEIVRQEAAEINRQKTVENVKTEERRRQEPVENVRAEERRRQEAVERVKVEEIIRQETAEINRQEAIKNVKAVERVKAEEIIRQEAAKRNRRQVVRENVKVKTQADVCLTKGCVKAAAAMIERMDDAADPCQDFFQFSCGSFVKKTVIPDEKSSVTMFSQVKDELDNKLRILAEIPITVNDSSSTLMVKHLYESCMNTTRIEKMGLEPLRDILMKKGGWPVVEGKNWRDESNFSWVEATYRNREAGFSTDFLFDFSVTTDFKNSSWRMIWFDQPTLGMKREYLVRGLADKDVKAYLKYSVDLAIILGADPVQAQKEMKDQLLFQLEVANITLPREERRDATKLYNLYTIKQLQTLLPQIPWLAYVNTISPPAPRVFEEEVVGVSDISYFQNLINIFERTPTRVIANYLQLRAVTDSVSFLSDDVRDIQLQYDKSISGTSKRLPRWKECMAHISTSLSFAISNLYVKNYFDEEAKKRADELVMYLRQEFDSILRNIDWMDEVTRQEALTKAAAIRPNIAYPPELLLDQKLEEYYKGLTIDDGILIDNMIRMSAFRSDDHFSKLRERVNKTDWERHGSVAVVNAYYRSIENSITFPAGILQGVFFEPDRPKYMNFGGIGFVIGHEITHGFDDQGKQFDSEGNLRNWWKAETEKNFLEKAKCIIHQYGNYTAAENGMMINGINTQGENIADNGGVKQAYHAYQRWVSKNGKELALPGMEYDTKQLFWISAAQVWCSAYRPEFLKRRILTGYHSPAIFRVNGPLSNSVEFAKDFNCIAEGPMNRMKKCSVW